MSSKPKRKAEKDIFKGRSKQQKIDIENLIAESKKQIKRKVSEDAEAAGTAKKSKRDLIELSGAPPPSSDELYEVEGQIGEQLHSNLVLNTEPVVTIPVTQHITQEAREAAQSNAPVSTVYTLATQRMINTLAEEQRNPQAAAQSQQLQQSLPAVMLAVNNMREVPSVLPDRPDEQDTYTKSIMKLRSIKTWLAPNNEGMLKKLSVKLLNPLFNALEKQAGLLKMYDFVYSIVDFATGGELCHEAFGPNFKWICDYINTLITLQVILIIRITVNCLQAAWRFGGTSILNAFQTYISRMKEDTSTFFTNALINAKNAGPIGWIKAVVGGYKTIAKVLPKLLSKTGPAIGVSLFIAGLSFQDVASLRNSQLAKDLNYTGDLYENLTDPELFLAMKNLYEQRTGNLPQSTDVIDTHMMNFYDTYCPIETDSGIKAKFKSAAKGLKQLLGLTIEEQQEYHRRCRNFTTLVEDFYGTALTPDFANKIDELVNKNQDAFNAIVLQTAEDSQKWPTLASFGFDITTDLSMGATLLDKVVSAVNTTLVTLRESEIGQLFFPFKIDTRNFVVSLQRHTDTFKDKVRATDYKTKVHVARSTKGFGGQWWMQPKLKFFSIFDEENNTFVDVGLTLLHIVMFALWAVIIIFVRLFAVFKKGPIYAATYDIKRLGRAMKASASRTFDKLRNTGKSLAKYTIIAAGVGTAAYAALPYIPGAETAVSTTISTLSNISITATLEAWIDQVNYVNDMFHGVPLWMFFLYSPGYYVAYHLLPYALRTRRIYNNFYQWASTLYGTGSQAAQGLLQLGYGQQ